jgi:hypothetical protein
MSEPVIPAASAAGIHGRQPRRGPGPLGLVDWRKMREQARTIMADWGFDVDADAPCASLTVEQRQVVEITRALAGTQGYGEGIIFAVFAAAVIGGVSLQGGRGNMVGAASGVILLGVVQNILDLENAPNYWIDAIDGAVILVALILARVIGGEASAE